MPFAGYEDFDACVIDQKSKGHSDDSAHKICGALQAQAEKKLDTEQPSETTPPIVTPSKKYAGTQEGVHLVGVDPYSRSVMVLASTPDPAGDQPGIKEWDLSTWMKNPAVLWGHDQDALPIGYGEEPFVDAEGLHLKVCFATEAANPLAEQVFRGIMEHTVRAVSVGYELVGPNKGKLLELSFVSLGLDENAGTEDLNPAAAEIGKKAHPVLKPSSPTTEEDDHASVEGNPKESMRMRLAEAASVMAKHRAKMMKKLREAPSKDVPVSGYEHPVAGSKWAEPKTDQSKPTTMVKRALALFGHTDSFDRYDVGGRLDKAKRTSLGGAYVNANITRTGVLSYRMPDGSMRRELRHPDEVFKKDSLATLADVPVIDIRDHTAMVGPDGYKRAACGHLKSYRRDGNFVAAELVVQDQDTLDAIDRGDRTEISCGYVCTLDFSPGTYNGEAYDCIQRNISYNHVALCPPNRGRAGPDVGLRLDTNTDARWGIAQINEDRKETTMSVRVKLDGIDYEYGSEAHVNAEIAKAKTEAEKSAKARLDSLEADKASVQAKLDEVTKAKDALQAKLDATQATLDQERLDKKSDEEKALKKAKEDAEAKAKKARARRRMERFFSRYFSGEDDDSKDDDDGDGDGDGDGKDGKQKKRSKKYDAVDEKLDAMSDRDLMVHCIKKVDPRFDATDRSDDYLEARFDAAVERVRETRSVDGVVRAAQLGLTKLDASEENNHEVAKARAKRDEAMKNIATNNPWMNNYAKEGK